MPNNKESLVALAFGATLGGCDIEPPDCMPIEDAHVCILEATPNDTMQVVATGRLETSARVNFMITGDRREEEETGAVYRFSSEFAFHRAAANFEEGSFDLPIEVDDDTPLDDVHLYAAPPGTDTCSGWPGSGGVTYNFSNNQDRLKKDSESGKLVPIFPCNVR